MDIKDDMDSLYSPGVLGRIPDRHGATELEAATGCNLSCLFQTFSEEVPVTRETCSEGRVTWQKGHQGAFTGITAFIQNVLFNS